MTADRLNRAARAMVESLDAVARAGGLSSVLLRPRDELAAAAYYERAAAKTAPKTFPAGSQVDDEGKLLRLAVVLIDQFLGDLPADVEPPSAYILWLEAAVATVGPVARAAVAELAEIEGITRRGRDRLAAASSASRDLTERTTAAAVGRPRRTRKR